MNILPEKLENFLSRKTVHGTWAGTFYCKPEAIFQPRNIEEIKILVDEARMKRKTIVTVGSGHSPSDLTMTNEWLCNLDYYDKVLKQEEFYGPKKNGKGDEVKFVDLTVQSGCRIYQLNEYLKKHKLSIQNLGSISEQSIAGIISTGTHGSTLCHGLVSQQVVSLEVMNAEGKVIKCSSLENIELFKAALLSLGKIGIITQVTLRTIPQYTIRSKTEIINFGTLLSEWDAIFLDSEFIRIWWFPYSEKCVCWRGSKTTDPILLPQPSFYDTWFSRLLYESLLWVSVHLFSRLTPYIERFVFKQQYGSSETLGKGNVAVQHSVEALNMDCLFSQFVNEWSTPMVKGPEVLSKLHRLISQAASENKFYVHAPIEVRCSNTTNSDSPFVNDNNELSLYPSSTWLSKRDRLSAGPIPGNNLRPYLDSSANLEYTGDDFSQVTNEQLTLYINATMYRPFRTNVKVREWYLCFETVMMNAQGKPHWAKNFIGLDEEKSDEHDTELQLSYGGKSDYLMKGFHSAFMDWYGDSLINFNKVRKSVDPYGMFLGNQKWMIRNGLLLP